LVIFLNSLSIVYRIDDDEEAEQGIERTVVNIHGVGERVLKVNTIQMQEKVVALQTLYQYAVDFGPLLTPYMQQAAPLIAEAVNVRWV